MLLLLLLQKKKNNLISFHCLCFFFCSQLELASASLVVYWIFKGNTFKRAMETKYACFLSSKNPIFDIVQISMNKHLNFLSFYTFFPIFLSMCCFLRKRLLYLCNQLFSHFFLLKCSMANNKMLSSNLKV